MKPDHQEQKFQELGALYTEDGYCVSCGNGEWKPHMPQCRIADLQDELERVRKVCVALESSMAVVMPVFEVAVATVKDLEGWVDAEEQPEFKALVDVYATLVASVESEIHPEGVLQ